MWFDWFSDRGAGTLQRNLIWLFRKFWVSSPLLFLGVKCGPTGADVFWMLIFVTLVTSSNPGIQVFFKNSNAP
jgi:hypothetical protein